MFTAAYYDGILRKPFLAEHWYKGIVAALAIWLPAFLLVTSFTNGTAVAVWAACSVSLLVAIAAITHHEGFSLDANLSRYRDYVWVMGLHFGAWKKMPEITHVSMRPYQMSHYLPMFRKPVDPVDGGLVANERNWQVLLSVKNSQIGIVAAHANEQEAKRISATLSQLLNVENIVQPAVSFRAD